MHVQRLFCTIGSTQTLGTAVSASISPRSIVELTMIRWEIRRLMVDGCKRGYMYMYTC